MWSPGFEWMVAPMVTGKTVERPILTADGAHYITGTPERAGYPVRYFGLKITGIHIS